MKFAPLLTRHGPAAGMMIVALAAYISSLHPGVSEGDPAELQCNAPQMGVLHAPGYPFVVLSGKAFAGLPLGGTIAWRVNLMCGVCGAIAAGLLFAVLRRMTGSTAAGLAGASTLAFSSIVWKHSVLAEVYTFYAMVMMGGLYCAVRFAQGGASRGWLFAAALLLGIVVSNRPSELFILPALLAMWIPLRRQAPLTWKPIACAAAFASLPMILSVAYVSARERPDALHARDDLARDAAVDGPGTLADLSGLARWNTALRYCLGLKWTRKADLTAGQRWERLKWDVSKFAWLAGGVGAFTERIPNPTDRDSRIRQIEQGRGTVIGPIGLILCAIALANIRRQPAWVLLGLGLFAGNFAFYLYHTPPDNLDFIIPGLIGLSILVGLGVSSAATLSKSRWGGRIAAITGVSSGLFLAITNFSKVNQNTPEQLAEQVARRRILAVDIPRDATLVLPYMRAQVYRYLLHVEGGRPDIRVISIPGFYTREQFERLRTFALSQPGEVFGGAEGTDPRTRRQLAARTPPGLAELGLLAYPR